MSTTKPNVRALEATMASRLYREVDVSSRGGGSLEFSDAICDHNSRCVWQTLAVVGAKGQLVCFDRMEMVQELKEHLS